MLSAATHFLFVSFVYACLGGGIFVVELKAAESGTSGAQSKPAGASAAAVPPSASTDLYNEGNTRLTKKQWAEAVSSFDRFVRLYSTDPRVPDALFRQGQAEAQNRDPDAAGRHWELIWNRYSKSTVAADALEQLILQAEKDENSVRASDWLQKLLINFPTHPATVRIRLKRAGQLLAASKSDEALAMVQPVFDRIPPSERPKFLLLRESLEVRHAVDPTKILSLANKAIAANDASAGSRLLEAFLQKFPSSPNQAEVKVKLGWCLYCSGGDKNLARAEGLWNEVLKSGAKDDWVAESRWHIVQLLAGPRDRWKDAAAICEQAAKDLPVGSFRHEQAVYTRAWLLWAHHDWPAARAAFQLFVQAYPLKASYPPIKKYVADCDEHLAHASSH